MSSKEIHSSRIRAARRTYFFDVSEVESGERSLKIPESRRKGDVFERSTLLLLPEHTKSYMDALADAAKRLAGSENRSEAASGYSVEKIREEYPKAYMPWGTEGDEKVGADVL